MAGKKRPASKKTGGHSLSNSKEDSLDELKHTEKDYDVDSFDLSDDDASTNN